jgi:hypothetical protein
MKSERYVKVEMTTDEETHLLKRIEELEALCDKLQTIAADHKHEGDRVIIDATLIF